MTILHLDVAKFVNPALKVAEDEHEVAYAPNGDVVLSPSQVTTYMMCPRKWAARYLHGQHEPVREGTIAGKRMHSVLEVYYNKNIVPSSETPEGKWAWALIRNGDLPIPGPGRVAERKFEFEHDGVWWRGSKDLTYEAKGYRVVRDHKSTSRLGDWIKTEEKLKTDPQSIIYAHEEYLRGAPRVRNEWGYVTRDPYPKILVTHCSMTKDLVAEGMEILTRVGKKMLRHYRERPALNDLPPDGMETGGCEAFQGCKVQGCNVTALDRILRLQLFKEHKEGTTMGYLDELRAKQAVKAAIGTPPPAPPVTDAAPPPAPALVPTAGPTARERLEAVATAAAVGASVVPPSFTPPAPINAIPPPAPSQAKRGRARVAATVAPAPAASVAPPADPPYTTAEFKQVPRVAPMPTVTYAPQFAAADGYVLCVNCAPAGEYLLFSKYVAIVHEALASKTTHYPLMGFDGAALYQDALRQALEQSPPQGYLVVDSRTNEGRDAMAVLERNASLVIRGF